MIMTAKMSLQKLGNGCKILMVDYPVITHLTKLEFGIILILIEYDRTSKEIAEMIGVSKATIENYIEIIKKKLKLSSKNDIGRFFKDRLLLDQIKQIQAELNDRS